MIVFLLAVAAAGAVGAPSAAAEIELGARYVDPICGFSLRPPAGADRSRGFSSARLVRWSVRDQRTGAIAWTLTVRREPAPPAGTDLKAYVKKLSEGLARRGDVRVLDAKPARVLAKDAFWLRTERGRKARRWQTEVWVLADEKRFLALSVNGPLGAKDELDGTLREIAATLRLTDPKALAAARTENLRRGGELLKGLTAERLAAAVAAEPRWYLYRRQGRDIGFLHVAERYGRVASGKGLEIHTFARLELKGGVVMYLRRRMFVTPDRATEKWTETAEVRRAGKIVRRMSEVGSKQGATIACKVFAGGKQNTRTKALPDATNAHYLPRAMAMLLPRLVDLASPAAYAFAGYTTAANDFDMRTFTVVGPEKITLGTKAVEAVRASDQVAADAEAAALHVLPKGALLRMRTDAGIVMEQATRSAVLRRFANAEALVKTR